MPDEISQILRRLDMTERNQTDQAKTLTEVVGELRETKDDVIQLQRNEAVTAEREKARDEWRARTEKKLDGIYSLGWWVLTTFGGLTLAALANLLYGGGHGVP